MDFYYKFLVPEEGRTFAEVKAVNLKRLPIVNFEFNQEPFIQKADLMLELNKKFVFLLQLNKDIIFFKRANFMRNILINYTKRINYGPIR